MQYNYRPIRIARMKKTGNIQVLVTVQQKLAHLSCKGPDSKFFRLRGQETKPRILFMQELL